MYARHMFDALIGACIALVVIVVACSIVWAVMRFKGGEPFTAEESAVPTAVDPMNPVHVLSGGTAYGPKSMYGGMG